jgi:cell division protein FtsB
LRLPRLSPARVIILLAAAVAAYLVFVAGGEYFRSRQLESDEQSLRREVLDLQRQHEELLAVREYLLSDEYIEGVARRMLGLVRPGETLVLVTSTDGAATPGAEQPEEDAQPEPTPDDPRAWWERLFEP